MKEGLKLLLPSRKNCSRTHDFAILKMRPGRVIYLAFFNPCKMNYQIITDEEKLLEFIDWLPALRDNEQYYLSLFARKKYCPEHIRSNDKTQLKRFTSTKERMFDKIRQLELPIGRWRLKDTPAPQESLVLYILPNPRCMVKATKMMGKHCWDLDKSKNFNLISEAISCVQKAKSRACFVDFDIDTKDVDLEKLGRKVFPSIEGKWPFQILETRGGYHILVNPVQAGQHISISNGKFGTHFDINWHQRMCDVFSVDQTGDQMIPVPGCIQGGFTPKFINYG